METNKMRCHFSIIFEKAGSFLFFWFIIALNRITDIIRTVTAPDFNQDSLRRVFFFCLVLIVLLLAILGYQFLVWHKTYLYIDGDTFVVERNTLNRRKTTFAISSISNINLEQNLFERIIGTYRLKLDTDSLSTANSTDVSVVLSAEKSTALKKKLLVLMKKVTPKEAAVTPEEKNTPYASTGEVLTHCFFSISAPLIFMALAVVIGIPLLLWLADISLWDIISENDTSFLGRFLALGILLITYAYSMLKQLFSFYHFCCFRRKDDLMIQYGLFRKQDFTIPVSHINAIKMIQPPLARLTGRIQAQLICVGIGDSDTEKPQLTLCMKKKDFYARMQELLPEFSTEFTPEVHKLPKGSGIVYLISTLFFLGCFSGGFWTTGLILKNGHSNMISLTAAYGIIFLLLVLYRLFHYFCMGTELQKHQLLIQTGAFQKQTWLVPYKKIQFINFQHNPLYRLFDIAKGDVNILASFGNDTLFLPFIPRTHISKLKDKLLS